MVSRECAKTTRDTLAAHAEIRDLTVITDKTASDGTRKWLFDVGSSAVDAVFIPEDERGTLCISSQAGCALDCAFCSTGKQGFNRNLSTAEIIGQLRYADRVLKADLGIVGRTLDGFSPTWAKKAASAGWFSSRRFCRSATESESSCARDWVVGAYLPKTWLAGKK